MIKSDIASFLTVVGGTLQLDLPADDFGAPIATYLRGFLPTGHLVLTGCVRSDATNLVMVAGTGTAAPFDALPMTIEFHLTGNQVTRIRITANPGSTWSLATAFPPLTGTMLEALRFDGLALTLDSAVLATPPGGAPPDPATAPMTVQGELAVTGAMAVLEAILGGGTPGSGHPLTGTITLVEVVPGGELPTPVVPRVELNSATNPTLNVGLFELTDLRYAIVGIPYFNYGTLDNSVKGRLDIFGTVPVHSGGTLVGSLEAKAILYGWSDRLRLSADFRGLGSLSLATVAQFVGQTSIPVPFGLDPGPGPGISLGEVAITMTPATGVINDMSMTLESTIDWTIVPNLLRLEAIDLHLRVTNPLSNPYVSVTVGGLLGIGQDGTLEIAADPINRRLDGQLREGDPPLRIREVYAHVTEQPATHLPELDVVEFSFSGALPPAGSPTAGTSFSAGVEASGDWTISDHVTLNGVRFGVERTPEATAFTAAAWFALDQICVAVRAAYDSAPNRGWEFSGSTGPGQQIAIGGLIESLAERFGEFHLPGPLAGLTIHDLAVDVSTGQGRLRLAGKARIPLDTIDAAVTVCIDTAERSFDGELELTVPVTGGQFTPRLTMHFDQHDPTAPRLVATYTHQPTDPVPSLSALVGAVSPTAAAYLPDTVTVDLKEFLLAMTTPNAVGAPLSGDREYIFLTDLDATLDLSQLPIVGHHFSDGAQAGLHPLRIVAASADVPAAEITALNGLLPAGTAGLPAGDLPAGLTVDGTLRLGGFTQPLALPVTATPAASGPPTPPAPRPGQTHTGDNATWMKIQRSLGPVRIARVGMAYRSGHTPRLAFLIDSTITLGPLTLSLDGLAAELPLHDPLQGPSFGLDGLGLSFDNGSVQITGRFLRSPLPYAGGTVDAYGGAARIQVGQLALSAIGSYAQLASGPSLFVYSYLDYPIGGPPFFFVKGLAAGFGYNRRLTTPPIDAIADFPLVAEARGIRPASSDVGAELQALNEYVQPSPGDSFLALGVRFTSFQMIDAFILLAAAFGERFELDLLGLATLTLPPPKTVAAGKTPLANIQLALSGQLVPSDGYVTVRAKLTRDSFVLSRDCHLSGELAFSAWFAGLHSGDFALTAGGYHPSYPVPAHYPKASRLAFNWKVSNELAMSGSAYFALTPKALMAGAALSAVWQSGSTKAWFDAAIDFLLSWQPFHYEASLHVRIGCSCTYWGLKIKVQVGTDLHVWGPDFGGTASVDLSIISFTIRFGAARAAAPQAVSWTQFVQAMLPERDTITTLALRAGARGTQTEPSGSTDLGVVDPSELLIVTDCQIPTSQARRVTATGADEGLPTGAANLTFGISPVNRAPGAVTATHRITITQATGTGSTNVGDRFSYTPVLKNLPAALWSGQLTPSLTAPAMVNNLLTGYEIRPKPSATPSSAVSLSRAALQRPTPTQQESVAGFTAPANWSTHQSGPDEISGTITAPDVSAARAAVLATMSGAPEIGLAGFTPTSFLQTPQVFSHV